MKKNSLYLLAILFALPVLLTTSCKEDEKVTPKEKEGTTWIEGNYDLWVTLGASSAMGTNSDIELVRSVDSLSENKNIDFKGKGTDVTSKLYLGSIIKDGYYYQVPKEKDRIGKYKIANGSVEVIAEVKFKNNTLKDRRYTHAWIDDNTFVLFGADGKYQKILWIKIDAKNMKILDEGTLELGSVPEGYKKMSTSGIANFRESDGKIIYAYLYKKSGIHREDHFLVAFINPSDMKVETIIKENRAEFMAGTAYGELNQSKTFFSDNGDYYIACNSVLPDATSHTHQHGSIVRIKAGTKEFDKSYLAYKYPKGKIVAVDYIKGGKALLYIQDPKHTGAAEWGADFNCYYAVLDLNTDELTELELPYSEGTFSQRSVVVDDKVYIGVNPKETQPAIYSYDINSGKLVKGLTITEGYSFQRIVKVN